MIVHDWLDRQARVRPDQPALVTRERRLTFAELADRVDDVARRLAATGVSRVGALLPNGIPLVELIHAAPRAGATLVLLDPRLSPAEVRAQAAQAGVGLLVTDDATRAAAADVAADVVVGGLDTPPGPPVEPLLDLDAPHSVVFTSGTAGSPKGVVLTAGNHLWSALGSAARLGAHADDRWLACLPLSHVGGLAVVLRAAIHGATVVLQHGFDVEEVSRALRDERVTLVSLVPTALGRLASLRPPPTLRCALIGGAAASPGVLASAHSRGWPVAPTYGCTEAASQVATAPPGTLDGVGQPILPTRVRIVRSDGGTAAVDEDGEIHVSGPTVTPGYAEPDGSLRPSARDGWLRTGDLGRLDGTGALRVLGRRDDVIVTGGENVAPAEVEAVLGALPAVAEVAVAGVDDAEWGRAVAAWVVPRPGAAPTLAALRDAARGRLAAHKLPRRLYLVEALPRTAAGKVRRSALRAPGD